MEEALTALLLDHAPLQALLGGRVHWLVQPRDAAGFPYLNLQVVSDPHLYHMAGSSTLRRTRVQADIRAETYAGAKTVARGLNALLSGYRGVHAGVGFQGIFVGGARDLSERTAGGERQLFRISADLEISWTMES